MLITCYTKLILVHYNAVFVSRYYKTNCRLRQQWRKTFKWLFTQIASINLIKSLKKLPLCIKNIDCEPFYLLISLQKSFLKNVMLSMRVWVFTEMFIMVFLIIPNVGKQVDWHWVMVIYSQCYVGPLNWRLRPKEKSVILILSLFI